jgi:uncharacterized protein (DUF433 family)
LCKTFTVSVSVLERDVFTEATAARLLGVPQNTLHYWLEGGTAGGRTYKPVIRVEPRGGRPAVTWAEFVEAGLLREYRQDKRVPMAELRAFIDQLRDEFGIPYPLADRRPYVSGKELVVHAQDAAGLDAEFCLVAVVKGQQLLLPPSQAFLERVTWEGDQPVGWRPPHTDPASPVRVFPDRRGGRPSVAGISTEVLWENVQGGGDADEVARMFDISSDDVQWAVAYEMSTRVTA